MESLSSVCYVGKIKEIQSIEGADNIELVIINGWNAITKKGEYNVGDMVGIATTDAVIPKELSDVMGVTSYLRKGQRVRTVKLRGIYSECLIIPKKLLPIGVMYLGKDLMDILGIFKYEPPTRQIQLSSGRIFKYHQNSNFGVYYKFPNIKNVAGMFMEGDHVEITRKIHGANARYGIVKKSKLSLWEKVKRFFGNEWVEYEFVYGSHNVEKGSDSQGFYNTDIWKTAAEKYNIRDVLWKFVREYKNIGTGVILYGEIYGAGIQKNYDYGLEEIEFAGFDLVINEVYQSSIKSRLIIKHWLQLPYVELLHYGIWSQEIQDQFVIDNFINGTKIPHEGIVVKCLTGNRHKVAKVINPDYLIYGEKNNVGDSH